ncbi:MAG: hypothetical protein C3F02_00465 [Parcubacteria group bacterium]|nr:MAG: hypothetical protein C3F02_00465 [Parcubacteria group bacterium]
MKIFFYNTKDCVLEARNAEKYLRNLGATVWNQSVTVNGDAKADNVLGQVEAVIVLGKKLDAQAGYMIALGLSQNKPVLYLLPEGSELDPAIKNLGPDKNVSGRLTISHFLVTDLEQKLADFLEKLDTSGLAEYFNIKYTLRVSRKLSDYLNWKAEHSQTKKADWIRDFIKELMEADAEYQKYLKNKFKVKK